MKHQSSLVPPSLFKSANNSDDTLSKLISSLSISNGTNRIKASSPTPRPTLQIFHRILTDLRITTCVSELASVNLLKRYVHVIDNYGERIHELVSEWYEGWIKDSTSEADVERRLEAMVEEVVVGCTLCFGVGGWAGRGDKNDAMSADFFLYVHSLSLLPLCRSVYQKLTCVVRIPAIGITSSPQPSSSSPSCSPTPPLPSTHPSRSRIVSSSSVPTSPLVSHGTFPAAVLLCPSLHFTPLP